MVVGSGDPGTAASHGGAGDEFSSLRRASLRGALAYASSRAPRDCGASAVRAASAGLVLPLGENMVGSDFCGRGMSLGFVFRRVAARMAWCSSVGKASTNGDRRRADRVHGGWKPQAESDGASPSQTAAASAAAASSAAAAGAGEVVFINPPRPSPRLAEYSIALSAPCNFRLPLPIITHGPLRYSILLASPKKQAFGIPAPYRILDTAPAVVSYTCRVATTPGGDGPAHASLRCCTRSDPTRSPQQPKHPHHPG